MRKLVLFLVLLLIATSAASAAPFDSTPPPKDNSHVGQNPGRPDGREGGETFADAVLILDLPFHDTGNTSDNVDDYDEMCPYTSLAPDVIYKFLPESDTWISIDLCLSQYDTALFIWDTDGNLVACNDDFHYDAPPCGNYTSRLEDLFVPGGVAYYIAVDGYNTDSGEYDLLVELNPPPEPCDLTCDGVPEDEPPLMDGYIDLQNSGCNDNTGLQPFQTLTGDENGNLLFCGTGGWYDENSRDTDWFLAVIGPGGFLQWTVTAEMPTTIFLLGPQDCTNVGALDSVELETCEPGTMDITGQPGEVVWLWVGASEYTPPEWFIGHEYNYVASFTGLEPGVVAVTPITFDGIKSLYR